MRSRLDQQQTADQIGECGEGAEQEQSSQSSKCCFHSVISSFGPFSLMVIWRATIQHDRRVGYQTSREAWGQWANSSSEAEVRPTQKVKFFAFFILDSKGSPGVLSGLGWSKVVGSGSNLVA